MRNDVEHLAGRRLLLKRFGEITVPVLELLKQPDVFNCDHRLIGKGSDEINLPGGKRLGISSEDDDDTNGNTLSEQRHSEHRHEIHELLSVFIFGISSRVGDVNYAALEYNPPCDGLSSGARRVPPNEVL